MLDSIRSIQSGIGDGLNDAELTCLLQKSALPMEAGFGFLSYSDRCVTFSVPKQEMAKWYPQQGWIMETKERIAREIAEKHDLSLCEPPDTLYPWHDMPNPHHHLEMSNGRETVVVAHSQYLKIRLFLAADPVRNLRCAQRPAVLSPDLLEDLSALYPA